MAGPVVRADGMGGDENSFFAGNDNGAIRRSPKCCSTRRLPERPGPYLCTWSAAERDATNVTDRMRPPLSDRRRPRLLDGPSMAVTARGQSRRRPRRLRGDGAIVGGGTPFSRPELKAIITSLGGRSRRQRPDRARRRISKMVKAGKVAKASRRNTSKSPRQSRRCCCPAFKEIFDWSSTRQCRPRRRRLISEPHVR